MKILKIALLLVLGSLFLLSACAGPQPDKPVVTNPVVKEKALEPDPSIYTKYDCWESLFNPHEVLDTWVSLRVLPTRGRMVVIASGNPKINWQTDYVMGTPFISVPVPEGEITSVVIFVFGIISADTVELLVFGYQDKYGQYTIYQLDMDKKCYILKDQKPLTR